MEYEARHLPSGVNLKLDLRVDDLQEEALLRLGEQLKLGLPRRLSEETLAVSRDVDGEGRRDLVDADVAL
jgi:hypothetical protein